MIEVNDVVNLNLNACCYTAEDRSCMNGLKSTVTEDICRKTKNKEVFTCALL